MNNTVLIILIVSIAVIVILIIFRKRLSEFRFKGGDEGIDMTLKTRKDEDKSMGDQSGDKPTSINVSRNRVWGRRNKIKIQRASTTVTDNEIIGIDQEIKVSSDAKKSNPQ